MNKKLIWVILAAIVILGGVLRLWQLGQTPASPDWDEVAFGYDSYSILNTGRDQFGQILPVVLRSLNDYKPALYAYLTIPSIAIFGLNVFAVRLPSAIFGILSILGVFYLVQELFENHKYKNWLSLISCFLFAISPWSIQFSRVAFESNVGTALNIFAALFFLKGLKKPWWLWLSATLAGLSIYAYQSEKVFMPLLALVLLLIFRKQVIAVKKQYLISAFLIGLVVVLPMLFYTFTDQSSLARLQGTSVFASQTELLKANLQKLNRDQLNNDKLGLILDNRRFVYAKTILQNYLSHFDLNWLFITGDIARHHVHDMGILYLFDLPFILLGLYWLLFGEFDKKTKLVIFSWILIAPIPASITTGVPSAVRTLNFLPALQILTAVGILSAFTTVQRYKRGKYVFLAICGLLFVFNFAYYLNQYFVQDNYYDSAYWQYGYKQAVAETKLVGGSYKQIVVSNKYPFDNSQEFFLFYLQFSPSDYQKSGAYSLTHSFGKYTFRAINWEKDALSKDILYIGFPGEFPQNIGTIKTIYNLDGSAAIKIVGT